MKKNTEIVDNQLKYEKEYSKIVVTYHDGVKKDFTPSEWAIFEKGVRPIAKKIKFVKIRSWKKYWIGLMKII